MRPLIVGNWKMHGCAHQLGEIASVAAAMQRRAYDLDVLLCLSSTLISRAAAVAGGRIAIGGEDCHAQRSGSFTGDVSADMLKDAGASAVIIGHSERRGGHCETNAMVAAKVQAAWDADLTAIVCVGEDGMQRDADATLQAVARQLAASLPGAVPADAKLAVAYEPVWAIGSGRVPTFGDIEAVHRQIRSCLVDWQSGDRQPVRILYGGSVTGANAGPILALPEVNGVLVGEASLRAHDFMTIVDAC